MNKLIVKLDTVRLASTPLETALMKVATMHVDGTCDVNSEANGIGCASTLALSMLDLLPDGLKEAAKIEVDAHEGIVLFGDRTQPTLGRLNIYPEGSYPTSTPMLVTREPFTDVCKAAGMIWRKHRSLEMWDLESIRHYSYRNGSTKRNYGYVTSLTRPDRSIQASVTHGKVKGGKVSISHREIEGDFDWDTAMQAVEAAVNTEHFFFPGKR